MLELIEVYDFIVGFWQYLFFFLLLLLGLRSGISKNANFEQAKTAVLPSFIMSLHVIGVISYLVVARYFDHAESQVAISSLGFYSGITPYPEWQNGKGAYGLAYGPLLYMIIALPALYFKSFAATKLIPVVCHLFALVWFFLQAKKTGESANITTRFFAVLVVCFGIFTFWVRGDALLLALACIACAAIELKNQFFKAVIIGVLAAMVTLLKVHGAIYLLPVAVYQLTQFTIFKDAMKFCFVGFVSFVLVIIACVILNSGDIFQYIRYLALLGRHGLDQNLLLLNVVTATIISLPFLVVYLQRVFVEGQNWRSAVFAVTLLGCVLIVATIGAKPGSGPHHLVPIIPLFLYFTLKENRTPNHSQLLFFRRMLFAICIVSLAPLTYTIDKTVLKLAKYKQDQSIASEVVALNKKYPRAQFGPTDLSNYKYLSYRVAAVLAGAKLNFSVAAWMDFNFAGIDPALIPGNVAGGYTQWILPKEGKPFSMPSFYKEGPLFPNVAAAFSKQCILIESAKFYNVWSCKPEIFLSEEDAKLR